MHRSPTFGLIVKHHNRSIDRVHVMEVLSELCLTGEIREVPQWGDIGSAIS